jgi:hypothetical protein
MSHARPGKSFMEMLELILAHQRRPNDPFSPQLLMAIFWEERLFTNKKQQGGTAIGFGQVEPAELPKLTTQRARDFGYEVPGVSSATRHLSDPLAVTVPSCLLLHAFHASSAPTREGKMRFALRAYAGVDYRGPSPLTREQRLRIIDGWLACERELKTLPFSVYRIVNYPGKLRDLEDKYMDALALARGFARNYVFSQSPRVLFRDLLFPEAWFMPGWGSPAPTTSSGSREDFLVVAGPGESVRRVMPGDVVIRQPRNLGPPQVARVRSAMVSSTAFGEGVAMRPGSGRLYAEVETHGARRAIWPVTGAHEHVPAGVMILRPSAGSTESFGEATDAELIRQRATLVANITAADLVWSEVPLLGGYKILVSAPVMKDDLFVPVTAKESMALARRLEVFPLSRAVMDQAHNHAVKVAKQKTPASLLDFVTYTDRLKPTAYVTQRASALVSGAHKLWVISARGPVINYGFYIRRAATDPVRCGPRLDAQYNVIQSLGAKHNGAHWDYSQLLQFMTRLQDESGQAVDLRQALLTRHAAVWDESQPPATGNLP